MTFEFDMQNIANNITKEVKMFLNQNLLTIFLNSKSEVFQADITLTDRNTLLENWE